MSNFTYEIPSEDGFFNAVMTVLRNDPKNKDYSNIMREGYCEISPTSSCSQRRWDAMYTIVNFYIPQDTFGANASNLADIREV